ncbi:hypothetical protein [Streptomyces sp. 5-6(2022)]|uniref:hypothetical protein n=1 Tax=Streptomyces sp. 5-6(2022) TaxID=2936510 RepID=UPI0023B987DE|nr:hypothetical protein [Streptomyces sp. 5-6(2022)]
MSEVGMTRSKKNAVGWIVGICVMAAVPFLAGCSADSTKTKDPKATQDAKGSQDEKGSTPAAGTTPSPKGRSGDQSTARGVVATWVTAVVQDRPKDACSVMATPATDGSPAKHGTEAMCAGKGPEAQQIKEQIHRLHTSFTPDQPKNPPVVKVAEVPVADKKATVDGEQITVDGQTLKAIVLSHSTGVEEDQVGVRIEAGVVEGRWYVTNLGLSVG